MALELRTAERRKAKLRIGISGPSGSGKTYSALLLAQGMTNDWGKIALIDTESGSGELYSDLGKYNVLNLEAPYTPERYIEAIEVCEKGGMEVVIIDSVSHEWDGKGGILEANEKMAQAMFKGNTWAAWSKSTPRHQKFIEAIVTSPLHVITTARSKTETAQMDGGKVKKIGTKEIQREGFEYELTVNFNLDRDQHLAIASKDRTGLFSEADPFTITEATGKALIDWANSGKDIAKAKKPKVAVKTADAPTVRDAVIELAKKLWPDAENSELGKRIEENTGMKPVKGGDFDAILAALRALPVPSDFNDKLAAAAAK